MFRCSVKAANNCRLGLCVSIWCQNCGTRNDRHTYSLLTPRSRVLLEKLTGFQLVKKFPAFYGNRRFITAVTSAFYGEMLAPRPNLKLEDHFLSAVRGCLFNTFAVTLHIGNRSSFRNRRTRHAVVTGTHLSQIDRHRCLYILSKLDYL